jgi:hypothetical protein
METRDVPAVVDADFRPLAAPPARFSADDAIDVHKELQRFIGAILGDSSKWPRIEGKPTPPALELNKLWGPLGMESEFLSHNEHGAPGVHRSVAGERDGVPIHEFTCTLRVTSRRLGASCIVEADLSSDEAAFRKMRRAPETTFLRQRCATRARNTAIRLLSGFDVELRPEEQAVARAEPIPKINAEATFMRAVWAKKCPDDKNAFKDWAAENVRGCEKIHEKLTPSMLLAIDGYLSREETRAKLEPKEAE